MVRVLARMLSELCDAPLPEGGVRGWGNVNVRHGSTKKAALGRFSYPHGESNANRGNRNPKFYPLNYGGNRSANIRKIHYFCRLKQN